MAGGYSDGSVIIDTKVSDSGAKAGFRELASMAENAARTVARVGREMAASTSGYVRAIRDARTGTASLTNDQRALEKAIRDTEEAISKRYEKLSLAEKRWEAAQQAAVEKAAAKFGEMNRGVELMPWESEEEAMEQFAHDQAQVIDEARKKFGEFEDSATFRNLATEITYLTEKLDGLRERLAEVQQQGAEGGMAEETRQVSDNTQRATESFVNFGRVVGSAASHMMHFAGSALRAAASLARIIGGGVLSFLRKLASGAANAAAQLAKLSGRALTKGIQVIGSAAGMAGKALLGMGRNTRGTNDGFKSGLKTILKYGFGVRSLFFLFRRLKATVKEGFGELAKYDPKVKSSIASITTAFNGLKGAFSGAFAPILTAVAPALTTLINLCTKAFNAVGMLIAALTGQSFYNAAKGLDAVGSAAGGASGSVKDLKRQLAGFDELNILSANSSGGGGGGGGSGSSVGYAFENVPIAGGIADFVDKIKTLFANGEYEEIGRVIAGGINKAIGKVKDFISWDNIGPAVTNVVTAVTGAINGLVDGLDWAGMGEALGEGLNTFVNTLTLWFDGINWKNLGTKLATGLNSLVGSVGWENLGELFGKKINSTLDVLYSAVSRFNWSEAGTAFAAAVNGLLLTVKWSTLTKAFGNSINGVVDALTAAVNGFSWGEAGKTFASNVNLLLTTVKWSNLGKAIGNSINGVLDWLYNAVSTFDWGEAGKSFAATVNKLLLTVKWSTLTKAFGTSINGVVDALTEAVSGFDWGEAGKTFAQNVNLLLVTVKWSNLGKAIGNSINGVLDWLYNAVSTFDWGEAGKSFASTVNGLLLTVKWSTLTKAFGNSINGVVNALTTAVSGFDWGEAGKTFATNVNLLLTTVKWTNLGKAIGASISGVIDWLHNTISTFEWGKAGTAFAKAVNGLKDTVKWGALGETISNLIKGALAFMKNAIRTFDWIGFGEKIKEALLNIDWKGIGEEALKLFLSGWTGIMDLLITELFGEDFAREFKAGREKVKPELEKTKDKLIADPASVVKDMVENKNDIDVPRSMLGVLGSVFSFDNDKPVKVYKISDRKGLFDWLFPSAQAEEGNGAMGKATLNAFENFFTGTEDNTDALNANGRKLTGAALKLFGALNENTEATEEYTYDPAADPFSSSYKGPSNAAVDWNFGDQSVTVGVDFQPNGATGGTYKNGGLINYLAKVFAPGTDTQTRVELIRNGFTTVGDWIRQKFMGGNVEKGIGVVRSGFSSVAQWIKDKWMGGGVDKGIGVIRNGFTSIAQWIKDKWMGEGVNKPVGVTRNGFTSIAQWIEDNWMGGGVNKPVGVSRNKDVFTSVAQWLKDHWMGGNVNKPVGVSRNKDVFTSVAQWLKDHFMGGNVNKPVGVVRDAFTSVAQWIKDNFMGDGVGKGIGVYNDGWTDIATWIWQNLMGGGVGKGIGIFNDGWSSVASWIIGGLMGGGVSKGISLVQDAWKTVSGWVSALMGGDVTAKVDLVLNNVKNFASSIYDAIKKALGLKEGGIISAGGISRAFASGGMISGGGRGSWWNGVPKYAAGTHKAHGTLFVAGEAGPEIMGHVNGRTEVLNRSQLAQTMYSAVAGGMVSALRGLQFRIPAMATGSVMPYAVSEQIARSSADLQNTLDANNEDLIQTIISVAGQIVAAVNSLPNRQRQSAGGMDAQQLINEINRRTQMFSVSPLKGV